MQNFFSSTLRCFNNTSQFARNPETRAIMHGRDYREQESMYACQCIASFHSCLLRRKSLPRWG
jgi:hypothetical protein